MRVDEIILLVLD